MTHTDRMYAAYERLPAGSPVSWMVDRLSKVSPIIASKETEVALLCAHDAGYTRLKRKDLKRLLKRVPRHILMSAFMLATEAAHDEK